MLRYLSAEIICSEKQTAFQERSSRNTVCYEEQINQIFYQIFSLARDWSDKLALDIYLAASSTARHLHVGE